MPPPSEQVMDTLHVHAGIGLAAADHRPEDFLVIDEIPLKHVRDLVSFGHDVIGDEMLL